MEILSVENLSKTYGEKDNIVKALQNINLNIEKGEFVAIVGRSGSGKSTLLHLLGGLDTPSGGKVRIDGEDIYGINETQRTVLRRNKIGFIFQAYNLIPVLTAEENITLPVTNIKELDITYVEELMSLLKIEDRKKHLPSELSGGQQQRVAIARAMVNKPSIILADEPTGNLDSQTEQEVLVLLKQSLKKYNQTLVMITHNLDIAKHADRVIRIEDGELQREVTK